jgi:hypothetical protein
MGACAFVSMGKGCVLRGEFDVFLVEKQKKWKQNMVPYL